jgi:hypothetical protein
MGTNEVRAYAQGYTDGSGGHDENEMLAHQRSRDAAQEYLRGYRDGQAALGAALVRATDRIERRIDGTAKRIVVVHDGGSQKKVAYLGVTGEPYCALIAWPLAGVYEVSLKHGRVRGPDGYLPWRMQPADLKCAREEATACRAARKIDVYDEEGTAA